MITKNNIIKEYAGNLNLLEKPLTAFLCSSKYSAAAVLRSYDWAMHQREQEKCVISGFHSPLEKDVLDLLLKGTQPVIIALARGMIKRIDPKLQEHIENGRLLIVSFFQPEINHISKETAQKRNEIVASFANEIVIAHASKGGKIEELVKGIKDKKVIFL